MGLSTVCPRLSALVGGLRCVVYLDRSGVTEGGRWGACFIVPQRATGVTERCVTSMRGLRCVVYLDRSGVRWFLHGTERCVTSMRGLRLRNLPGSVAQ